MSLGLSPMLCLWVCEYNQGLYKAESFVVTWGAKTGRLKNATAMLQNFLKNHSLETFCLEKLTNVVKTSTELYRFILLIASSS